MPPPRDLPGDSPAPIGEAKPLPRAKAAVKRLPGLPDTLPFQKQALGGQEEMRLDPMSHSQWGSCLREFNTHQHVLRRPSERGSEPGPT
jgi:hypothetical protein